MSSILLHKYNYNYDILSPFSPPLSLSSVLQESIDVLTNAITYAIHNQTPSSTDDTLTDDIPNSPVLFIPTSVTST